MFMEIPKPTRGLLLPPVKRLQSSFSLTDENGAVHNNSTTTLRVIENALTHALLKPLKCLVDINVFGADDFTFGHGFGLHIYSR
jgi:hypothetical protein